MSVSSHWWAPRAGHPEEARFESPQHRPALEAADGALAKRIAASCEDFRKTIASVELEPLLRRVGDARIVLLGEATHGTSEFYRMRERISRELIEQKGFSFIAIEGDWPDAARIDHYVRHAEYPPSEWTAFARFPVWMCRRATRRCASSLTGCERVTPMLSSARDLPFTASICTAFTTRSGRS